MATAWPSCKVGLFWSCRSEISFDFNSIFFIEAEACTIKLQIVNGEDSSVTDYKKEKRGHVMKIGSWRKNVKVDTSGMVRMGYRDREKDKLKHKEEKGDSGTIFPTF